MTVPKVPFQALTDEMHEWLLANPALIFKSEWTDCQWCPHDWHSLVCRVCRCMTSQDRPDDTWRPVRGFDHADQARLISHETGVDGWAATACVGVRIAPHQPSPPRLKRLLYGQPVPSDIGAVK